MATLGFARFVAACLAVTALACPARASVTVQITPATLTVAPNSDFDVKLRITAPGSAFNAFSAIVVYDPSMITPVQLSPLRTQLDSADGDEDAAKNAAKNAKKDEEESAWILRALLGTLADAAKSAAANEPRVALRMARRHALTERAIDALYGNAAPQLTMENLLLSMRGLS